MNYLITVACFGSHLPGQQEGIVNHKYNRHIDPFVELSPRLVNTVYWVINQPSYILDLQRADAVLTAMLETCNFQKWHVYAIHVRTNHVHAVLAGADKLERMMNDLKSYASRKLNELGLDPPEVKRWVRHGSTRYLWGEPSLAAAIRYVVEEQGAPMAVYPLAKSSPPSRSGFG